MKKLIFAVFLFSLLAGNVFANDNDGFGIGTVFYGGYGYGPGLLLKFPVVPLYWGISVGLKEIPNVGDNAEQYFRFSISFDYHFIDKNFPNTEKFSWFLGGGIIYSHSHFEVKDGFAGRIPIGIYFTPVRRFDIVLEFAPAVGLYTNYDSVNEFDYGMHGSLGIRYWF